MHDWRAMNVTVRLASRYQGHSLSVQCYKLYFHSIRFLWLIQTRPRRASNSRHQDMLQINRNNMTSGDEVNINQNWYLLQISFTLQASCITIEINQVTKQCSFGPWHVWALPFLTGQVNNLWNQPCYKTVQFWDCLLHATGAVLEHGMPPFFCLFSYNTAYKIDLWIA